MRAARIAVGGIAGGLLAAIVLASAGRLLGWSMPPWSSDAETLFERAIAWGKAVAALAPPAIVAALAIAFTCAVVFEFVSGRGGAWRGSIVGLCFGVGGAALAGLLPWLAWYFDYVYLPLVSPLGPHDATWMLASIAVAGVAAGAVAGACYGTPLRDITPEPSVRFREIYRRATR